MTECAGEHNKIYEHGVAYLTDPPQRKWICSECGLVDWETEEVYYNSQGRNKSFRDAMKKFHG